MVLSTCPCVYEHAYMVLHTRPDTKDAETNTKSASSPSEDEAPFIIQL